MQREERLTSQLEEKSRDLLETQNRLKQAKEQTGILQAEWDRSDSISREVAEKHLIHSIFIFS